MVFAGMKPAKAKFEGFSLILECLNSAFICYNTSKLSGDIYLLIQPVQQQE